VNLHGDMVVTNRDPTSGPSSVTKFAAEPADCIDLDADGIETSTGPDDVKPWGEDECMIWNTPLPNAGSAAMGCRATAWDGSEDEDTGEGGRVWIGCMFNHTVYILNGDTGMVEGEAGISIGPYGGAMDGRGSYWTVAMGCTVGVCNLSRLNMITLTDEVYHVPCGYGISVDREGRIWTAGLGCVNRLDPLTGTNTTLNTGFTSFNRGIAVDDMGSVWAAVTTGEVLRVNEDDVTLIDRFGVYSGGASGDIVGVAIDFQQYVWAVAYREGVDGWAIKINPIDYSTEAFEIGKGPYTYSDMTGYQLSIVEIPI
jgi:streptogramin lyase